MLNNLFTKKTTITLSKALDLKEIIQDKLKSNYGILKRENSVLQGQKRNYNLKKIEKESKELQDQIVPLKLEIQRANLFVPDGEKFCISYYVYLLSEKKAVIQNLRSMLKESAKELSKDTKDTTTLAKPVYSYAEIEDWLNILQRESRAIEDKLTLLNNTVTVELPFKTKLV